MSERNGIKNQFDPLLDKLETRIEELEQENAELKRWNANLKTNNFKLSVESQTILEHCKDLERIIAESDCSEIIAYWDGDYESLAFVKTASCTQPLYASPAIQEGMVKESDMLQKVIEAWYSPYQQDGVPFISRLEAMLNASKEVV